MMWPHRTPIRRVPQTSHQMIGNVKINTPAKNELVEIANSVPCRFSYSGKRINTTNSDGKESLIVIEYLVFFKKNADIKRGDLVEFDGQTFRVHNVIPIYGLKRIDHYEVEVVSRGRQ